MTEAGTAPDAIVRLHAVSGAYRDFAATRPKRYRVMFGGLWSAAQDHAGAVPARDVTGVLDIVDRGHLTEVQRYRPHLHQELVRGSRHRFGHVPNVKLWGAPGLKTIALMVILSPSVRVEVSETARLKRRAALREVGMQERRDGSGAGAPRADG